MRKDKVRKRGCNDCKKKEIKKLNGKFSKISK